MKIFFRFLVVVLFLAGLSSCYQMHSSDDLRSIPVTNNPHLVPSLDGMGRFIAMP